MPFYEYECSKCGCHTEILQRISDLPLTKCEHCNGKMKKIMSQSTFHLKGSGWYVTDYASKSGGNDGKTGSLTEPAPAKEAKSPDDKPKKKASSDSKKITKDKD
jgi:putative FmdB family regulatory protein